MFVSFYESLGALFLRLFFHFIGRGAVAVPLALSCDDQMSMFM